VFVLRGNIEYIRVSHNSPTKFSLHSQVNVIPSGKHIPPFKQEFVAHGSLMSRYRK